MNILIVGAGFSGAVVAERLSRSLYCKITVIDERSHIGGNCHTARDERTGVMVHTYGPHIFNTDNAEVWKYIQQFSSFKPYTNRVKAVHDNKIYSFPINLHTINQFFETNMAPVEAKLFLEQLSDKNIGEPRNFEEQALKFLGRELYHAFIYGYTKKQWGCDPKELPASILKRLPVRFNYNDNYYSTSIQGIPIEGYIPIFEKMLDHPNIEVKLNTRFDVNFDMQSFDHVFYTGCIDAFFNFKFGRLSYRTVYFEKSEAEGDYQGNAVINYTDESVPYTRIHEHKHFMPWEQHDRTVYFKEYSKETEQQDIPFYPKRLVKDLEILALYQAEVKSFTHFTFLGRLATYRYIDMHEAIADAISAAKDFISQNK